MTTLPAALAGRVQTNGPVAVAATAATPLSHARRVSRVLDPPSVIASSLRVPRPSECVGGSMPLRPVSRRPGYHGGTPGREGSGVSDDARLVFPRAEYEDRLRAVRRHM